MDQSASIPMTSPAMKSQDFAFLREEGMELLRDVASQTWTDHNLHDPGITLLEACCYAITEMGLRSGMDVRDLVASDVSGFKQQFYSAAEILPDAALTLKDFRKVLIDHPLIRNAWLFMLESEPTGRFSVLLEFENDDLNSNTFSVLVTPASKTYQVDVAFPYWDDPDVQGFSSDVTLLAAVFDGIPGNEWSPISGSDSYFARITVGYQPAIGPPQTTKLWIVVQVNTPMDNPTAEIPTILPALTTIISTLGDNSPADHTLIKEYSRRVTAAHDTIQVVQRYVKDYRNLCEDFAVFNAVRLQEIALSVIIEVNPGVILENLLADIFYSVDQFISPDNIFEDLDTLRTQLSSEEIFDGPLLESGFLPDSSLSDTTLPDVFYTSDILRLILKLRSQSGTDVVQQEDLSTRNIVAVRSLSLANYLDNHIITSNARDCLRLVESQRHVPRLSIAKSRVTFYRNGVEVSYDLNRVIQLFNEKKAVALLQETPGTADIALPQGQLYPVADYYPIQNDLPFVYGVGEAGLPETATDQRRAQALQLKGYMFFFEQLTAGLSSQLAHFNEIFSADSTVDRTTFQLPLYNLPQVDQLLKGFDPLTNTWSNFLEDNNNGYITGLDQASESYQQFLSRRNRILDHIMAVFGEDMRDKAALAFRQASVIENASSLTLQQILDKQTTQRNEALQELINEKSAFIFDLPELSRDRAQSYGNPAWRTDKIVQVQSTAAGFGWSILGDDATVLFHASSPASSQPQYMRLSAEAFSLATSADHYVVKVESGGLRRLELRSSPAASPVAESDATYATDALALAAVTTFVQTMLALWVAHALTPLEARLYHMLGLRLKTRRPLLFPITDYVEIYNEPIVNPDFEKRFRLWSLPLFAGDDLLESENHYPGTDDANAIANTNVIIQTVVSRGIQPDNYQIMNPAPGVFQIVLRLEDGTMVARSPISFASVELAQAGIERIVGLLYEKYSAAGFYLVEHLHVYPNATTDPVLQIENLKDPFSFQLSVVLPSGFERDFSITPVTSQASQPEANRDPEYRTYAELQVRKACPGHILPRVLWVDRMLPGSPPSDASFDSFEQRYRAWLQAYFTDGVTQSVIEPLQNDLVRTLNAIYQELAN